MDLSSQPDLHTSAHTVGRPNARSAQRGTMALSFLPVRVRAEGKGGRREGGAYLFVVLEWDVPL
jgi:hypothetical protein